MEKTFLNKKRKIYLTQNFPENLLPNKKLTKKSRSLINQKTRSFQNRIKNHLKNLRKLIIRDLNRKSNFKDNFSSLYLKNYKNKNFLNYGKILYNGSASHSPLLKLGAAPSPVRSTSLLKKGQEKSVILLSIFLNIIPASPSGAKERAGIFYKLSSSVEKETVSNEYQSLTGRNKDSLHLKSDKNKKHILDTSSLLKLGSAYFSPKGGQEGGKKSSSDSSEKKFPKFKYSLEQILSEFYKKNSQSSGGKKQSFFKELLMEQKKLSIIYGNLSIKEIQKSVLEAKKKNGNFEENLIKKLESRLDVVLYRICFFNTIFAARQSINHGQVLVNNKKIVFSGYILKPGDIIKINKETRKSLKDTLLKKYKKEIEGRSLPFLLDNHLILKLFSSQGSRAPHFLGKKEATPSVPLEEGYFENKYNPLVPTKVGKEGGFLNKSESYFTKQNVKNLVSLHQLFSRKKDKEAASLQKQVVSPSLGGSRVSPSCFLLSPGAKHEVGYKNPWKSRDPSFSREENPFLKDLHNIIDVQSKNFPRPKGLPPSSQGSKKQEGSLASPKKENWDKISPALLPVLGMESRIKKESQTRFGINKLGFYFLKYLQNFFDFKKKLKSVPYKVRYTQKQILKQKKFSAVAFAGLKHKPLDFYMDNMEKSNQVLDLLRIENFLSKKNFTGGLQILETTKQKGRLENSIKIFVPSFSRAEEDKKQIFNIKEKNKSMISFLILKKKCASKNSPFLRLAPFRVNSQKPVHLEISYKNLFAIFLYSPQRALFPTHIDFAKVRKIFR